jgi:hypothetical protein
MQNDNTTKLDLMMKLGLGITGIAVLFALFLIVGCTFSSHCGQCRYEADPTVLTHICQNEEMPVFQFLWQKMSGLLGISVLLFCFGIFIIYQSLKKQVKMEEKNGNSS